MTQLAFVDREKALEKLSEYIDNRGVALAWLWGEAGIGKTFLLRYLEGVACGHPVPTASDLPRPQTAYVCALIEGISGQPVSPQSAVLQILDQLAEQVVGFVIQQEEILESSEPPGRRKLNNVLIQNLKSITELLAAQAKSNGMATPPPRIVILIDDFEYVGHNLASWLYSLVERPTRRFRKLECLLIVSGRQRMESFGSEWGSLGRQDQGIRETYVTPFGVEDVEELKAQIDPHDTSGLDLWELHRRSEGVPELIRLLLESGGDMESREAYVRRVFKWPEDQLREPIVQASAIPRYLDSQIMALVSSVVNGGHGLESAKQQLDWLNDRDYLRIVLLHDGEERWALRPALRFLLVKHLYSIQEDLYEQLHNTLLAYYTSKLAHYHQPGAFADDKWQLLKREQVFHALATNPRKGLSEVLGLFIQFQDLELEDRIIPGQALCDILAEVAEIQNKDVLRSWAERFQGYYEVPTGPDEEFRGYYEQAGEVDEDARDYLSKVDQTEKELLRAICENKRRCSDPSSPYHGYGELSGESRRKALERLWAIWDEDEEKTFEDFVRDLIDNDPDDKEALSVLASLSGRTMKTTIQNHFSDAREDGEKVDVPFDKPSPQVATGASTDFIGSRLQDLADNIRQDMDLLKEYEDALRYEDDPRRRAKYRREIERLRESATRYQEQYGELRAQVTGQPPAAMQDIAAKLKHMDVKLDALLGNQTAVRDDLSELRRIVLARFDTVEQTIITAAVERLDQSQVMTVEAALDAIEAERVSESQLQEALAAVAEALSEVQQQRIGALDPALAGEVAQLTEVIKAPQFDVKHKLKIAVPIIPLVLSYEGEVELQSGLNLEAVWQRLLAKVRRG